MLTAPCIVLHHPGENCRGGDILTIAGDAPRCCTRRLPNPRTLSTGCSTRKDSIANTIVNHVTVGRAMTVAHLAAMSNHHECRLIYRLGGAGARTIEVDILQKDTTSGNPCRCSTRGFSMPSRAICSPLGASSENTKTVHTQAFVKPNGAMLKREKGRQTIVMEYADLLGVLVLR